MSSSDRRVFLKLLTAAPLAACGFTPAYAPGGPARKLLGHVEADAPNDKHGFDFVGEVESRLGPPAGDAPYRLTYGISVSTAGLGITASGATTRYDLIGSASYTLRDRASGKVLTQGSVNSFTSYSAAGTPVSTITDREAAQTRLMTILADQVVDRLIASAGDWAK
ncbi:MAG: hypothetical protein KGI94_00235 [Paracoccaceae bacterium]|nr:hypothetical protein [Paracoccaceae bacterium]MDE3121432.1 hypothetical protein [Paracoccaceae bacterium]MDE3240809.1 hypothetical protein [Paracoccaceae bacterium]